MLMSPISGVERALVEDPIVDAAVGFGADPGTARAATQASLMAIGLVSPQMLTKGAIKAGSLAEKLSKERGVIGFHGTPRKGFTEFDPSKVGTGQGAQAFGHGFYVAENPQVAGTYARLDEVTGSVMKVDIPDAKVNKMIDWDLPLTQQSPAIRKAFKDFDDQDTGGDIYRHLVEEEHRSMAIKEGVAPGLRPMDNQEAARRVSEELSKEGIPGIKYLDALSRTSQNRTSNFVVFDPNDISIIK